MARGGGFAPARLAGEITLFSENIPKLADRTVQSNFTWMLGPDSKILIQRTQGNVTRVSPYNVKHNYRGQPQMHAYGYTYDQVFSHTIAHYLMTCSLAKVLASLKSLKHPKLLHHYSFTFLGAFKTNGNRFVHPHPHHAGSGVVGASRFMSAGKARDGR